MCRRIQLNLTRLLVVMQVNIFISLEAATLQNGDCALENSFLDEGIQIAQWNWSWSDKLLQAALQLFSLKLLFQGFHSFNQGHIFLLQHHQFLVDTSSISILLLKRPLYLSRTQMLNQFTKRRHAQKRPLIMA